MRLKYVQPGFEKLKKEYEQLISKINKCDNFDEQLKVIKDIYKIRDHFSTMQILSMTYSSIDVNDEYYQKQEELFAKYDPIFDNLKMKFYQEVLKSKYISELVDELGSKTIEIFKFEVRLLNDDVLEDLENAIKLGNEYGSVRANTLVSYASKKYSFTQMGRFMKDNNPDVRRKAFLAVDKANLTIENKIDDIFDKLVKIRTEVAKKSGFNSYTDYSYIMHQRIDYDKNDIKAFRDGVKKYFVPLMNNVKENQKKELGIDKITFYDETILFKEGNPKPLGDTKWIVDKTLEIFKEYCPKIYEVMKMLVDEDLMDLDSRPGKKAGGFMDFLPEYDVTLIFANFDGTSASVEVMLHELGHCVQYMLSKNNKYTESINCSMELAEVYSMSLELLPYKYYNKYYGDTADKILYKNLADAIRTICYVCLVDEFQHIVYDNPALSIEDRKIEWLKLERKYMPWLDYAELDFYKRGNYWHRQLHIFTHPFYYIDYALAQVIALQFYFMGVENPNDTLSKYLEMAGEGGINTFRKTIEKYNLLSPFNEETFKVIGEKINL